MKNGKIRLLVFALTVTLVLSMGSGVFAAPVTETEIPLSEESAEEVLIDDGETDVSLSEEVAEEVTQEQEENPFVSLLEETAVPSGDSYDFTDEESKLELLEEAADYPAAYDLREKGVITPVKSQAPFGSCWAFAATAAAESSLVSQKFEDVNSLDLSEKHLAYFTFTSVWDESNSQYGEGYKDGGPNGMTPTGKMGIGGNSFLASSVYASGAGPVAENSDPSYAYKGKYENIDQRVMANGELEDYCYSSNDYWGIDYSNRDKRDYSLKESYVLPAPADVDDNREYHYNEAATAAIKKQLMAGRAVQIGYLADQASPGDLDKKPVMLSDDWAQYGRYVNIANHAVTIVGWDDTIGAEDSPVQFKEDSNPLDDGFGPGAWLVKNSWGSGEEEFPNKGLGNWGIPNEEGQGTGYFWLSYYDHSIASAEAVAFEKDNGYLLESYNYLPTFEMHATEFDHEAKMANIFFAQKNEVLKQISFYTTHPNTSVSYEIYIMPQGYPKADDGRLMASGDCGTFEFGGFHKVDIEPVTLMYGQNFSIVITEKTSDGKYSLNVPVQTADDYISVINECESLYQVDGGYWMDLSEEDYQADLMKFEEGTPPMLCDNFAIKGYAEPLEGVLFNAGLSGSTTLYFTPEDGRVTLQLVASRYLNTPLPTIKKVKWELDDTIYDIMGHPVDHGALVDFEGLDAEGCGNRATAKVRKEGDKYIEGSEYLFVRLYGEDDLELGTIVEYLHVSRLSIDGARLKDEGAVFIYNGSAFEPELEVIDFNGNTMRKDLDYTADYIDNIKCGVAKAEVYAAGDYEGDVPTYCFFPIQPAKAVLKKLTAGACMVTVTVEDQAESAITGYQVQYREKGTNKWKTQKFDASSRQLKVTGLAEGKQYEVQACGYVEIEDAEQYWGEIEDVYYGEFSEIMTSDTVGPAKAVEKIAFEKTTKELATKTSAQLKVKFTPSDATDQRLTWTSSNPEVAAVDKNGNVTAKTRGTATITVKSKANSSAKATCKVTVKYNDAYYDLDGTGKSNVTKEMETAINWAADQKITGEKVSFGTKNSMTRGQFVRFLYRYAGQPKVTADMIKKYGSQFKDVDKNYSHYKAIVWAVSEGLIAGYSGGVFKPKGTLTRSNVATILWKYAGSPKVANPNKPFSDVDKSAAIAWGKSKKIFTGTKFEPKANCLRGDFALFLYRYNKAK